MSTVNTIPGWAAAAPAGSASSPAAGVPNADTFLKLLVAEMRTQNPLDPQKGTDFVTQLAQFNTLEQLIQIRTELEAIRQQGGSPATPPLPSSAADAPASTARTRGSGPAAVAGARTTS